MVIQRRIATLLAVLAIAALVTLLTPSAASAHGAFHTYGNETETKEVRGIARRNINSFWCEYQDYIKYESWQVEYQLHHSHTGHVMDKTPIKEKLVNSITIFTSTPRE